MTRVSGILALTSSPPKHLSDAEVNAFFDRLRVLRPDITLFVMDTALRLSDKVVPMLITETRTNDIPDANLRTSGSGM